MSTASEVHVDGPLTVASRHYGKSVVVSLAGELDRSNVATAERVLFDVVEGGDDLLVIDLAELEFLDSSGIATLVALSEIRDGTDSLRILPSPALEVTQMLALTGIGSLIHFAAGPEDIAA